MQQKPNQRLDSVSNSHVGQDFELTVQNFFAGRGIRLKRGHAVEIGLREKKLHRFDLGCDEQKVLVECKAYRWTAGGNDPSAKITTLNQEMLYFLVAPEDYGKILCIERSVHPRKGSLGRHYVRLKSHLIPDGVEFWEFDLEAQTAEKIYPESE
ncbi:hypothetical protein WDJ50_17200 [Deinococcus sp. VB142]|uniref:Endonuclease n=1 Tax=Deinococcus sp. VB142 TaxID=3112952 RepID=A0AAU6Q6J2_9DEIO